MPKTKINGLKINYQLDGNSDETIVILNGIMMSSSSWEDFVSIYTKKDFQILRMDFRDQGDSDKYRENYDISIHVNDLKALLDELRIEKVHLLGVSYGAMVAMLFELKYPEMIKSMVLSNTEAKVTDFLKSISDVWEIAAASNDGHKFFKLSMPFIYSDYFYNHHLDWLQKREDQLAQILDKNWYEALIRLSKSSKNFDIFDQISNISSPTLLIAADRDILTPVKEMEKMKLEIPDSKMLIIKNAGHAAFYEKMDEFNTAVLGFIMLNC
ncbi:MAG: alpha/beta hydrolase [Halanaerobiales bacterium]|nr:alpha/beta hydrolase [Halanaerobiales bacterium]